MVVNVRAVEEEITLRSDFGTVEMPVSSQFQILSTSSLLMSTSSSREKKASTVTLLKLIARAADVASGLQRDGCFECLSINTLYQS